MAHKSYNKSEMIEVIIWTRSKLGIEPKMHHPNLDTALLKDRILAYCWFAHTASVAPDAKNKEKIPS